MKKWIALVTSGIMLGLAGCGGGGSDGPAAVSGPVISSLDFPVRSAYHNMMAPENPIALTLAGTDNANIDPTLIPVDWPSWSKLPAPSPELVPADLRWAGTLTAQRRELTSPVSTPLGEASVRVDYFISLKRIRDGREYRDALSIYFDVNYRPLAAVTQQSSLWNWLSPVDELPISGRIGVSSGTAVARACKLPVGTLSSLVCDPEFLEAADKLAVPAVWTLQADTAQTGFITFAYRAPFLDAVNGGDSAEASQALVEIKMKVDGRGDFKGAEYVRIEGPLTIRLRG